MRYLLLIFLFSFVAVNATAQDLKTLERGLRRSIPTDVKAFREKADSIYRLDPYNETATRELVYFYRDEYFTKGYKDSISSLFNKLKGINPLSPVPYVLYAKYTPRDYMDTSDIAALKTAIKLDSNNFEAHYLLGTSCYDLFHKYYKLLQEHFGPGYQKSVDYYAAQSRLYLIKATRLHGSALAILRYPIIQLSVFLHDSSLTSEYESKEMTPPATDSLNVPEKYAWYYPFTSFLELEEGWKKDYSADVIWAVSQAVFTLNWYSEELYGMQEPLVYTQTDKVIYRFTWLRSFHYPVAIRVEKIGNTYTLYWKLSSGAGDYAPAKLITNKSKKIRKKQWDKFTALLQSANFWNMPTKAHDQVGTDGSRWIVEGVENGRYHVVDRWTPRGNDYQECGKYLIDLTGLKLKGDALY